MKNVTVEGKNSIEDRLVIDVFDNPCKRDFVRILRRNQGIIRTTDNRYYS
jgi:hypothetical protein